MILTIFQDKILSGQFFLLAYAFSFQVIFNILFSMSQRVGKDIFHFTGMVSNLLFFKMSIYSFMYILIKVIMETYLVLFCIEIRLARFELIQLWQAGIISMNYLSHVHDINDITRNRNMAKCNMKGKLLDSFASFFNN